MFSSVIWSSCLQVGAYGPLHQIHPICFVSRGDCTVSCVHSLSLIYPSLYWSPPGSLTFGFHSPCRISVERESFWSLWGDFSVCSALTGQTRSFSAPFNWPWTMFGSQISRMLLSSWWCFSSLSNSRTHTLLPTRIAFSRGELWCSCWEHDPFTTWTGLSPLTLVCTSYLESRWQESLLMRTRMYLENLICSFSPPYMTFTLSSSIVAAITFVSTASILFKGFCSPWNDVIHLRTLGC